MMYASTVHLNKDLTLSALFPRRRGRGPFHGTDLSRHRLTTPVSRRGIIPFRKATKTDVRILFGCRLRIPDRVIQFARRLLLGFGFFPEESISVLSDSVAAWRIPKTG